ncbi:MAG: UDP-4-amino-4,6-dideoxy-N-acetyl-beta-L-altrosamine transaminase [Lachnospiraceae bacterium]|jgi:UDP-4-amino-4,6-dideoxy-N-acetyl-beta-L-altrosamine transaminase|nr:UDP-4-amino-4,6-dideoxy-N-acetyl-beta-L-altrosamine transaminase [Lachnospiraceae bacterium]
MEIPAIIGGIPIRSTPLFYGHQYIDEDDVAAVAQTMYHDLTCGPEIGKTEQALCEATGAKYCVLVSSGTAALHIAAMAAGISPGDEVIVSSITFAASANCVLYCGGTPIFADIDKDTYNIDPADVKRKITPQTKAVIAVDFTGQVVDIAALREWCSTYGLLLIEDAAHSLGSRYNGKRVGSLADMTTFSFHPVKTITGGEGGAVTTNDPLLYEKLLLARTHGITRDRALMEHPSEDPWYNEQISLGYNYRITDIQAALIRSQLQKLPLFSARRKEICARYNEAFHSIPELIIQREIPESDTVRHLYILRLRLSKLTCTRREFFDALCAEGIHPQVHYLPVYWHSYYEKLGYKKGLCPHSEEYYHEVMSLPLYYSLTDQDVSDCIAAVRKLISYYRNQERVPIID